MLIGSRLEEDEKDDVVIVNRLVSLFKVSSR
jgi:hypothetical protein